MGLRAIVYGSALERGLVEVEALELVVGSPRDAGFERVARAPVPIASEGGRQGLLAEWRTQPIPAGPGAAQPSDAADWPAFLQAQQRAALQLNVRGRVVGAGEGSLVVLLESPAEPPSQVAARYRVRVDASLWEPLRFAPPPTPMSPRSMLLRRLSGERHRVLLAALSPEARERVSADALERFGGLLEGASLDGGLGVSAIWADPSRRPKVSQHRRWPIRGLAKKLALAGARPAGARRRALRRAGPGGARGRRGGRGAGARGRARDEARGRDAERLGGGPRADPPERRGRARLPWTGRLTAQD